MQFASADTAVVRWETARPSATILEYGIGSYTHRFSDMTPKTAHAATMKGLRRNRIYRYRVGTLIDGQAAVAAARSVCPSFC